MTGSGFSSTALKYLGNWREKLLFVSWVTSLLVNIVRQSVLFKSLILGPAEPKYSEEVLVFKQITFDYGFEKWKDGNIFIIQILMNVTKDL